LLVFAPLLTRLYSPSDFGEYSFFISIITVLGVIGSLRYELLFPSLRFKAEEVNLFGLCIIIILSMSAILLLTIDLTFDKSFLNINKDRFFNVYLVVGFISFSLAKVCNYILIRNEKFNIISIIRIKQVLCISTLQLMLFKIMNNSLIISFLISWTLVVITQTFFLNLNYYKVKFSTQKIMYLFKRYKHYPLFIGTSSLINVLGSQVPLLFCPILFGVQFAGLYFLAHRFISSPLMLIGGAISDVYLSDGKQKLKDGILGQQLINLQSLILSLAIPVFIFLYLFIHDIITFLFGNSWNGVSEICEYMIPYALIQLVVSPILISFTIMDRMKFTLSMQVILNLFRISSLVLGYIYNDAFLFVITFTVSSSIIYLIFQLIIYRLLKLNSKDYIKIFSNIMFRGVFIMFPCILFYFNNNSIILLLMIPLSFYFIYSIWNLVNMQLK
jgi:O-antigen/teichoic acid export membrane protein